MSGKELVLKFYDEVFNGWDLSHLEDYMLETYIQHNPTVKNGREGFREFAENFFKMEPHMEIVHILEDGNMVGVFFKANFKNGHFAKVFDLYRIEDGKLAEHWDVLQSNQDQKEVSEINGNSIF